MSNALETVQHQILDITYDSERREAASDLALTALDPSLARKGFDTFAGSNCSQVIGAFIGDRVIATMGVTHSLGDEYFYVKKLVTTAQYQGRGLATELLDLAQLKAKKVDARMLVLTATKGALRFYINRQFIAPDPCKPRELVKYI